MTAEAERAVHQDAMTAGIRRLERRRQEGHHLREHYRNVRGLRVHASHPRRTQRTPVSTRDPTSDSDAAQMLSRASWRMRLTDADPGCTDIGGRGTSSAIRPTHFPSSPLAAGVARVLRFQPEIRGESYLAPGKVRQGVRTCGLKPQDTSPRTVCCFRRSGHMIGAAVSSSSAKADSFAEE